MGVTSRKLQPEEAIPKKTNLKLIARKELPGADNSVGSVFEDAVARLNG